MEKGKLFLHWVQAHLQPPPQSLLLEHMYVPAQVLTQRPSLTEAASGPKARLVLGMLGGC
jgi:hypothetical protein